MPRRFFPLGCLLVCSLAADCSFAQQTSYNYFYRNNWQLVNPVAIERSQCVASKHPTTVLKAGSRLQWIGLEGAPFLYYASIEYCPEREEFNSPNYKVGATAYGDRTDAIATHGFYGNFSYFFLLPWGRSHNLHLGASAGYVQYGVDLDRIHGSQVADDIILQSNQRRSFADFAIGAMYRVRRQFYLGISSPQTFGVNLLRDSLQASKMGVRQINLTGGWFLDRGAVDYGGSHDAQYHVFEPSFIVRYAPGVRYSTLKFLKNSPYSIDANLRYHYRRKFWCGGGASTNGSINLEGGIYRDMGNDTD